MDTWLLIVSISAGVVTVGTLLVKVSKVVAVLNKKCPCADVCELQEKVNKYDEYFSNDSRSIKDLDKRMAIVEVQVEGIDKKVDRIDENVIELMKRGAFGR